MVTITCHLELNVVTCEGFMKILLSHVSAIENQGVYQILPGK